MRQQIAIDASGEQAKSPDMAIRTKARPQNRRGEKTRAALLDAAESLFAETGFHAVTVREIARKAGADAALVTYYFGGFSTRFCCGAPPS